MTTMRWVVAALAVTTAGCGTAITPSRADNNPQHLGAPQACLDALDRAEDLFNLISHVIDVAIDGINATANNNQAGIDDATRRITDLGNQIDRSGYETAAYECREG